jgi:lauroyl/myristoyl acyltransferase
MVVTLPPPDTARARWHAHRLDRAPVYRAVAVAAATLPRGARLCVAARLGGAVARWLPAERAAIGAALARIAPERRGGRHLALVQDVFRHFAMCFADLVAANRGPGDPDRLVGRVAGRAGLEAALGGGRGAVVVTAHVGNWELGARLLARHGARPTTVVVEAEADPALERFLRGGPGPVRFVRRGDPRLALSLVGALRRGGVVAVQGDRALGEPGDRPATFFGARARFPLGPFVLARAAGVPVVAIFCLLGADRRYEVLIDEPREVGPDAGAALDRYVEVLEAIVRRHPEQWFNFFDVWSPSPAR